jgi:subtilisin-like proprotein convertase family protein/subtilisin family serine protease
MTNQDDPGTTLRQGGHEMKLRRKGDSFAVRMKRGGQASDMASDVGVAHSETLPDQNLVSFTVAPGRRDEAMEDVRGRSDVEFASHVYEIEGDPDSRIYLTDEITVQFSAATNDDEIEEIAERYGLELMNPVEGVPYTFVFRVGPQATENPIKITNHLIEDERVEVAEPNITVPIKRMYVPTDSLFANQWHLFNTGGPFVDPRSHIDATGAWDITRGERSIVVAVADDSVDGSHSDFQGEGKVVSPRDFRDLDFLPDPVAADDNHGTACAGVAVAEENGSGVVGVAPGCALMPIRTTGFLDDRSIEDLFDWVMTKGASVVSCSWGPAARFFPLSLRKTTAMHKAATLGRNGKGCVIVFAAGNSNRPVDGTVNEQGWPNNTPSGPTQWLDGFAASPDVITVAASSSEALKSVYSNWGSEVSVCAPSNNAPPDTFPRVTAPIRGRGIVTTDRVGPPGYSSSDYTFSFGGTSSACPTAAGVAALVLSANPALTAQEVKEVLETTAERIEDPSTDPQLGNAFGTYDANGHSFWFGHGKVNAFNAVTEAKRRAAGPAGQSHCIKSEPDAAIPDKDSQGIGDTITVPRAVTIGTISVDVDITHTFRGDLRVVLTSPTGVQAVLHNRGGGGADNLVATYDATTTPALAALTGTSGGGEWKLAVQDLAAFDTGRLNSWTLAIDGQQETAVEEEESPGTAIPDNDATGVESALNITQAGKVREIDVEVDITHTYIGDLIVTLTSPAGTSVPLHSRTGGSADNLIRTYASQSLLALSDLRGEDVAGTWKLRVADRERIDTGKLNRWKLRILLQ